MQNTEQTISKIINRISPLGSENPLFSLPKSSYSDLIVGIKNLMRNPASSDGLNLQTLQVLTLLFDQLNSRTNNLSEKNIKPCLNEIWMKSRMEHQFTRQRAFDLLARIGNCSFYLYDLIKSGVPFIGNQNETQFDYKWNKRIITVLSCFDWFSKISLQGRVRVNKRQTNSHFSLDPLPGSRFASKLRSSPDFNSNVA